MVITRHAVSNYGSLLQAIATQQVIERLGHTCEIIDYVRKDESYLQHEKTILLRKPEWNNNLLRRTIYLLLRQPESLVAGKKFERAQKQYLKLTRRYATCDQLISNRPIADIYMTGSDQVWGPVESGSYDSVYCLSFTKGSEKRISYAASFGHTDMTPELEKYYKKWLTRYRYVSVREQSALEILQNIGINALQVIDPTLLLDAAFWNRYTRPIKRKKYVLVYQLHNDKRVGEYAKKVAEKKKLELIRISATLHQIAREGKFVWLPEIGKFLSYIKNAECMVTDSFHGTAFAINFNTPFVEILPNNNTETRNMGILKMTGLSDRILQQENDIDLAFRKVNYMEANKILSEKRKESIKTLKSMIEE